MKYYSTILSEMFDTPEALEKAEADYATETAKANDIINQYEAALKECSEADKKIKNIKSDYTKRENAVLDRANSEIAKIRQACNAEVHAIYEKAQEKYDAALDAYLDFIFK